jgi:hypothetical protein
MGSTLPMPGHSDTSIVGLVFLGLVLVVVWARVPPGDGVVVARTERELEPRGVVEVGIPASSGWAWSIAAMSSRSGLSIFAPVHPSTRLAILPGRVGRFTKRSC